MDGNSNYNWLVKEYNCEVVSINDNNQLLIIKSAVNYLFLHSLTNCFSISAADIWRGANLIDESQFTRRGEYYSGWSQFSHKKKNLHKKSGDRAMLLIALWEI